MANPKTKQMSKEQRELFEFLWEDREENAKVLEKASMEGTKTSVIDKYSEQAHFIYELLQNADDVKATKASFELNKDGLLFSHNGKIHFSISDPQTERKDKAVGRLGHVNSITSIGNTTKIESEIGKFGYGFKSVFQYSSTPHIYDPPFTFKIERLVVPILLNGDQLERVGSETMFFLPFNSESKSPDRAFDEIGGLLKKLDSHPLLFLRYLEKVEWRDSDGNLGIYRKKPNTEKKDHIISLITNVNGDSNERRFLVFKEEVTDPHRSDIQHTIGAAFNLHLSDNKIISENKYPAYCFFATREETGLRFIVQAPFLLTDNREGIKQGEIWNEELIRQLSELVANSLPKLRDIGLIGTDSLHALPIQYFPDQHLFRPVYDAVVNKFKSEERLLPRKGGGHINANQAVLARGKDLTELLDSKQLSLLLGKEDAEWIDTNITENSSLWDFINKKLEILVLRPEGVANSLHDQFMEEQTDKWVASFYAYLNEYPKLWKSPTSVLRKTRFIRLEDNTHVTPFREDGNPGAYLPTDFRSDFPTLKKSITGDEHALEFLKKLGLDEPDKFAEIIENILPKYSGSEIKVSIEENAQDIVKIVQALKELPKNKQSDLVPKIKTLLRKTGLKELEEVLDSLEYDPQKMIQPVFWMLLKSVRFLKAINAESHAPSYMAPENAYLSEKYTRSRDLNEFFKGNPNVWFLDDRYAHYSEIEVMIKELEIADKPRVIEKEFLSFGKYMKGFIKDYSIDGLEHFFKNVPLNSTRSLYLWKLLLSYQKDKKIAFKGILETSRNKQFPAKSTERREKVTAVFTLLTESKWLPDIKGKFHKPSEIGLAELPSGFDPGSFESRKLAEHLEFKNDLEQEYFAQLSEVERKKIELAKVIPLEELEILAEELKDQFPEKSSRDPKRRSGKVKKEARDAEEKIRERRERSVRTSETQTKKIARQSLRESYTRDGQMICQICEKVMPFKLDNGEYYFEAVEYVRDIKKEHSQNYLALCPVCAAKYQYANGTSPTETRDAITKSSDFLIPVTLARKPHTIHFVEDHMNDLKDVLNNESVGIETPPFIRKGVKVIHKTFGHGVVKTTERDNCTVEFENVGTKIIRSNFLQISE